MPKIDSNASTFAIALVVAFGIATIATQTSGPQAHAQATPAANAQTPGAEGRPAARWAASATGRIEPASGVVRVAATTGGRIELVPVTTNDRVEEGDVLVQLEDDDALARLNSALAEADIRKRERGEEPVEGIALDRQAAEDALYDAERELFSAWRAFDDVLARQRAGDADAAAVAEARKAIDTAKQKVSAEREDLARLNANPDMPLPNRLESSLLVARSDVRLAENAFERTRIRAPFDGTVLNVIARQGETAAPSPEAALLTFGDISKLKVRAEVEERDVAKVRPGQKVVVHADAFPNQEFEGTVTEVASALGSPRIASRGPRRPNDVDVLEVVAELEGTPPLLTGMRVDVFFRKAEGASAARTQ